MTKEQSDRVLASAQRIAARAAELMLEHQNVSVEDCVRFAAYEEVLLHCDPRHPDPNGVLSATWVP